MLSGLVAMRTTILMLAMVVSCYCFTWGYDINEPRGCQDFELLVLHNGIWRHLTVLPWHESNYVLTPRLDNRTVVPVVEVHASGGTRESRLTTKIDGVDTWLSFKKLKHRHRTDPHHFLRLNDNMQGGWEISGNGVLSPSPFKSYGEWYWMICQYSVDGKVSDLIFFVDPMHDQLGKPILVNPCYSVTDVRARCIDPKNDVSLIRAVT